MGEHYGKRNLATEEIKRSDFSEEANYPQQSYKESYQNTLPGRARSVRKRRRENWYARRTGSSEQRGGGDRRAFRGRVMTLGTKRSADR